MSVVDPFGTPHTDKLHVVERYQLFSTPFGKGLEITVEVDDPGAFTSAVEGNGGIPAEPRSHPAQGGRLRREQSRLRGRLDLRHNSRESPPPF